MTNLVEATSRIANNFPIGTPGAVKRGRTAARPYVAVLKGYLGKPGCTHNPMGKRAYGTYDEAVAASERYVAFFRTDLHAKLLDPRYRALRESYGLPRELPDPTNAGE